VRSVIILLLALFEVFNHSDEYKGKYLSKYRRVLMTLDAVRVDEEVNIFDNVHL